MRESIVEFVLLKKTLRLLGQVAVVLDDQNRAYGPGDCEGPADVYYDEGKFMAIQARLDASLSRWNLLDSDFYRAWSAGTLPVEALATYSQEYGAFIQRIAAGWAAHGDEEIAAEERKHTELWRRFAASLGTDIGGVETPAVRALVEKADRNFADPVTSLGALYAFEAQQPATAATKLEGLRRHYRINASAERYFEVHAQEEAEAALLLRRLKALSVTDQERAADACEEMAGALRDALDDLYNRVACQTA